VSREATTRCGRGRAEPSPAGPPRRRRSPRTVDETTRLLADLVAIPSVNPMGRDVSGPE